MAKDAQAENWGKAVVSSVGGAMKRARAGGRTAAWLSTRTGELGYKISPTVIAKLESGHRGEILNLPELLVIAAALNVPPLSLLFPNILEETELLPGQTLSGVDALGWFTGTGDDGQNDASAMQVALQLVSTEKTLKIQRHNLFQAERGPQVLEMSKQMQTQEAKNAEHARERIAFLESERERLLSIYGRFVGGEFDA